jgi:hypothetical protein
LALAAISGRAEDAVAPAKPEGPKYLLRYKFKPGEIIRTQIWHRASSETTIEGVTQSSESTSGSIKAWKIVSVDAEGQITFEHSVESVNMRQKVSDHQEVTYNSLTDKDPPPIYASVPQSLGKPLTVLTIDPSGQTIKRVDKRQNAPADSQNNDMVFPLPENSKAIGESWDVPHDITISLENNETKLIKTRQHYTLEKVANGVATISVATQVLTPVNNPKIQSQLVQRLTQGTVKFDIDNGRILSKQLDLDERVLGFHGNNSSIHFVGRFTEDYLPPEAKTAAKPKTTK